MRLVLHYEQKAELTRQEAKLQRERDALIEKMNQVSFPLRNLGINLEKVISRCGSPVKDEMIGKAPERLRILTYGVLGRDQVRLSFAAFHDDGRMELGSMMILGRKVVDSVPNEEEALQAFPCLKATQ